MLVRLRRRSFTNRLLRAPALFLTHYRIIRDFDGNLRWPALLAALRLTWAAVRP